MFWKKRTYLDAAAGLAGNPSSPHEEGRHAKKMLEDARTTIARLVEVQADDVIFTSGATEANALAILGHVRALREIAGKDSPGRNNMHVLYLPSSHASIVENVKLLADEHITIEELPIKDWRVDTDALAKLVRPETVLVAMDAVCGETGVIWNTREVAETLRKAHVMKNKISRSPELTAQFNFSSHALLHVDASQAPLTEKITRDHFGADMITFDAAKVGPIHGCGVLIAHRTIPLVPLYKGGGQERGLRPGTENPEAAQKFAAALRAAVQSRNIFRAAALVDRTVLSKLITALMPDVLINEGRTQVPNILNLSFLGRDPSRQGGAEVDTDYLVALQDEAGFAVSTRSACETDSELGSRAVFALTGDQERARATLRISWGRGVSSRELTRFAKALTRAVAFIDRSGDR